MLRIAQNRRRVTLARILAVVAAFLVLSTTATTSALAAEPKGRSSAPDAELLARTPGLTPFYSDKENVYRNVSTDRRNQIIHNCPPSHLCVAAGEGDGEHTVFVLYYCADRTLSNFIGDGAIFNNQPGVSSVGLGKQDGTWTFFTVDIRGIRITWDPYWYMIPC